MTEVIYNFAMSLDGFIARPSGSFDWLEAFPADDAFDFSAFMDSITGIVMGRGSYDAVRAHWDYERWPTTIATNRPIDDLPENATASAADPQAMLDDLRARGANGRIWLFGGGDLARRFLEAGLLTTVEIALIPVILGDGVRAFGGAQPDRWLELESGKALGNGAMHLRYRVKRA
ncbi:dihydrofolate reductase [Escherichia coli]|nr:dihydrofolate reductase [Salmonella enterica subsp. enterica serovar Java]EFG2885775.1 dihydrofolate reductase [Escherichia coli]